jgi:hypothetical protein
MRARLTFHRYQAGTNFGAPLGPLPACLLGPEHAEAAAVLH